MRLEKHEVYRSVTFSEVIKQLLLVCHVVRVNVELDSALDVVRCAQQRL